MSGKETPHGDPHLPQTGHHWGSDALDPFAKDIPSLKFSYLMPFLNDANAAILEVGCGNGKILRTVRALNASARLHGCDVREPEVAGEFEFSALEGDDLPYRDGQFDVVLAVDVLEHVRDYRHCLDEIQRVLRPGGFFLAFVPCEGNRFSAFSLARVLFGKDVFLRTKEHVWGFTTRDIMATLRTRFEIREVHYSCHALGQTMDCILFCLTLNKRLGALFWNTNKYYNSRDAARGSVLSVCFNALLSFANRLAYFEGRLFRKVRFSAAGLHVTAVNRGNAVGARDGF